MAYDEYRSTARWNGNVLLVRWLGSQYEDEAGYWVKDKKGRPCFMYDGHDDTFYFYIEDDVKLPASEMLSAMQAHQFGY